MAVGRSQVSADQPWSLSPAGLRAAPATAGLVLPSPNGSAIASVSSGPVVAACLRNAAAVARWVAEHAPRRPVTVIAAGERWPDGSLRPALEDLLGAGAVLHELSRLGFGSESPEAVAARLTYSGTSSVADAVRCCGSGLELIDRGFAADVEVAVEIDSAVTVPVLSDRAFRAA
jgi:2-phosphosulfolactate phosphatase